MARTPQDFQGLPVREQNVKRQGCKLVVAARGSQGLCVVLYNSGNLHLHVGFKLRSHGMLAFFHSLWLCFFSHLITSL